ncbi:hypothetical protein SI65_08555 [Aspergillus cristatus]|uniref:Uncharacterized protein n=1 Tax=Aspergillus cristatus TaxID=573508 RepID=A0A1E3B5P4_ASPCR|nr:hypothetical protein SI65_08555 [Aspergillus cristatus]
MSEHDEEQSTANLETNEWELRLYDAKGLGQIKSVTEGWLADESALDPELDALLTEVEADTQHLPMSFDTPIQNSLPVVLDLLAAILISRPRKDVIAAGLKRDGNTPVLVLAANGGICDETYNHAQKTIKQLKALGRDIANFRKDIGCSKDGTKHRQPRFACCQ